MIYLLTIVKSRRNKNLGVMEFLHYGVIKKYNFTTNYKNRALEYRCNYFQYNGCFS